MQFAAETDPTRPRLEGTLLQTRLKRDEGHFAMGLSTDEPVRFQGFHAENLLVVLDEACGVPEEIWDAIEGICVGTNNRVLAISNPLAPTGHFYSLFKSPRWKTFTISALAHPNVRAGAEGGDNPARIPGAVTWEAVADRISAWCEPADDSEPETKTVLWEGARYRPNALFRIRVLGEFPESADDSLFMLSWLEAAQQRHEQSAEEGLSSSGVCVLAVDVARFGSDETVFAVRRGNRVTRLRFLHGLDTMEVAKRVQALALEERADIVTVDEVGVGAGVADRLREEGLAGLTPINFGTRPHGLHQGEQFLNLRAQTYWTLRERFRSGQIAIPRDETLVSQLAGLRYGFTTTGQIQIESKDEMRRRGLSSPDRADALALLFCPQTLPTEIALPERPRTRSSDAEMLPRTVRWSEVDFW